MIHTTKQSIRKVVQLLLDEKAYVQGQSFHMVNGELSYCFIVLSEQGYHIIPAHLRPTLLIFCEMGK